MSARFGRYEIICKLAEGGMAEVYLAELAGPSGFKKRFAIKQILPELSAEPEILELLLDEAKIAAGLSHPNICQVYELGTAEERPFIVMEYLEGAALGALLRAAPPPPPLALAWAAARAASGLSYAHQKRDHEGRPLSIVHRDVSLDNVMVTLDGQVKLLDFGIARAAHKSSRTKTGLVRGKIAYMSPEQIRNEALDARTDVYSLGVVLWELLAGRRLYSSQNDVQTMYAVLSGPLPARPAARPVPSALWEIAEAAMERDPARRLGSAAELAERIDRALEALGYREGAADLARSVAAQSAASQAEAPPRDEAAPPQPREPRDEAPPQDEAPSRRETPRPRTRTADAGAPPPRTRTADAAAPAPPRAGTASTPSAKPKVSRARLGLALGSITAVAVAVGLYPTTEATRAASTALARDSAPPASDPPSNDPPASASPASDSPASAPPSNDPPSNAPPPSPTRAPGSPTPSSPAPVAADPPPKRPGRAARSSPRPSVTAPAGTGRLVLDTHPWTKIYLGGRFLGDTPLNEVSVPSGHLELRAVNVELGIDKLIEVDVAPDRLVRLRREW